jgi:hypothetical protein
MQTQTIERRSYAPTETPCSILALPFVADVKTGPRKKERDFWHVPETDDYCHANDVGRQYACDYVQYLKDNPFWVGSGTTGHLVHAMQKHEAGTTMNGYAVGFWAFIEKMIYFAATGTDHYSVAERDAERTAAALATYEQEVSA